MVSRSFRNICDEVSVDKDSVLDRVAQPKCSVAESVLVQLSQTVVGESAAQLGPRRAIDRLAAQYTTVEERVEWA